MAGWVCAVLVERLELFVICVERTLVSRPGTEIAIGRYVGKTASF